jgi:hypothetical protein
MLLVAILGGVLFVAAVGLVLLMSQINDAPGGAAIERPAGAGSRKRNVDFGA